MPLPLHLSPSRPSFRRAKALVLALFALGTLSVAVTAAPAEAANPCQLRSNAPFEVHDITGRVSQLGFYSYITCVGVGRVQAVTALQHFDGRTWTTTVGPIYGQTVTSNGASVRGSTPYCFPGTYRSAASGYANGVWQGVAYSGPVYLSCARR